MRDYMRTHGPALVANRAAAEGAPLVAGIVVAYPHRNRDLVRKSDEPGVVLVVAGAGMGEIFYVNAASFLFVIAALWAMRPPTPAACGALCRRSICAG